MAEFAYNNAKNASIGLIPFELNCGYHPRMLYEEDVDPRSQSKLADCKREIVCTRLGHMLLQGCSA